MEGVISSLSPEHQEVARELWQKLAKAHNSTDQEETRRQFDQAPPQVKCAVLREFLLLGEVKRRQNLDKIRSVNRTALLCGQR